MAASVEPPYTVVPETVALEDINLPITESPGASHSKYREVQHGFLGFSPVRPPAISRARGHCVIVIRRFLSYPRHRLSSSGVPRGPRPGHLNTTTASPFSCCLFPCPPPSRPPHPRPAGPPSCCSPHANGTCTFYISIVLSIALSGYTACRPHRHGGHGHLTFSVTFMLVGSRPVIGLPPRISTVKFNDIQELAEHTCIAHTYTDLG